MADGYAVTRSTLLNAIEGYKSADQFEALARLVNNAEDKADWMEIYLVVIKEVMRQNMLPDQETTIGDVAVRITDIFYDSAQERFKGFEPKPEKFVEVASGVFEGGEDIEAILLGEENDETFSSDR